MEAVFLQYGLFAQATVDGGQGLELSLEHSWMWPPWVTLLLLLAAASFAAWTYLRTRPLASPGLRVVLALLRLTLFALVIFMMYGWAVNQHRTDLPDLVVVLDDSQSMGIADQSLTAQQQAEISRRLASIGRTEPTRWNQQLALLLDPSLGWLRRLEDGYRLKLYRLGESARLITGSDGEQWETQLMGMQPQEASSLLGDGLQQIVEGQRGRPTAAIVWLTDGVYTGGRPISNAAELAGRRAIPLFVLGLGSDVPPRDLRLANLIVDDSTFVDDVLNFDVTLHHDGFADRQVRVVLRDEDGNSLAEQAVVLGRGGGQQPVRLSYRPTTVAQVHHRVEVDMLDGDANPANNRIERTVDVRDAQVRVLLIQHSPSYEFRELKHLLSRAVRRDSGRRVVELTTVLQEADFEVPDQDETAARALPVSQEELFAYDVIIIGDADPSQFGAAAIRNLVAFVTERGGGMVVLAGPRFSPAAFRGNPLEDLLPVELGSVSVPDPDAVLDTPLVITPTPLGMESPQFQLGSTRTESDAVWGQLPGCYWFTSARRVKPAARVLAQTPSQPLGEGQPIPVISMQFAGAGKVVFHATDETYRWARHQGDRRYYGRYWLQLIRYLSRSKLLSAGEAAEVYTDQRSYQPGEAVRVQVEFRDDRQAPVDDDGVRVALELRGGRRRELALHRNSVARGEFTGFVDDLDPGEYRLWLVSPSLEPQPAAARFRVEPPEGEFARLQLNSSELQEAARISRGRFYKLADSERLLSQLPKGRQVRVESLPATPIWNSNWLAALFVVLIAAEWLLRRRVGMV